MHNNHEKISPNQNRLALVSYSVIIGVLGRMLPHLPNVTPLISLSLFIGAKLYSREIEFQHIAPIDPSSLEFSRGARAASERSIFGICEHREQGRNKAKHQNAMGISRILSLLTILITMVISDGLLAYFYGYPVFSYWSIFVYSGFFVVTLFGRLIARRQLFNNWRILPFWISGASSFYWLWTNFGVWLTSGIYAKNSAGLLACYVAALPFLRNAILGDLLWGGVIFGVFSALLRWRKRGLVEVHQ